MRPRRSRNLLRLAGIGVLALGLTACSPRIEIRGNLPDPERLAELRPGEFSREEVFEILGSPSSIAAFDQETWYYISERTETVAFMAPQVTDRKVLVLRFDGNGVLSDMQALGMDDGYAIRPVGRETPTAGNEITIMEQIFGNVGRFETGEQ